MVATDGNWELPVGAPVYTADDVRLGYVVGGDAYGLDVGDGFLFRRNYTVRWSDVDHFKDGGVVLKLRMHECVAREDA